MGDDLERLSRLLDDMAAERDPHDRSALSAAEAELAATAAFLKAADAARLAPDDAFVERLGAQIAARRHDGQADSTVEASDDGLSRRGLLGRIAIAAAGLAAGAAGGAVLRGQSDGIAAAQEIAATKATAAKQVSQARDIAYEQGKNEGARHALSERFSAPMVPDDRGKWIGTKVKAANVWPGQAVRFRAGAVEGFLVNPGHGREIYALSAACTHMGCMLSWLDSTDTFLCPCHGAQYSTDGAVLDGVARHPLPRLKLFIDPLDPHGEIMIWGVEEHPAITSVAPYPGF